MGVSFVKDSCSGYRFENGFALDLEVLKAEKGDWEANEPTDYPLLDEKLPKSN